MPGQTTPFAACRLAAPIEDRTTVRRKKDGTRLYVVSDFHASDKAWRKMLNAVRLALQLPEGLDYLREWLHLPAEIVPATHIKQQRSHAPPRGMMGGEERERRPGGRGGPRGDGGYRRREQGDGKEGGAPGEFAPTFRGGFGRGRGGPPQAP